MEVNFNRSSKPFAIISQLRSNTCFWIGHPQTGNQEKLAGQTFRCPANGVLDNIQVYSSAVQQPGKIMITVHSFDTDTNQWGAVIASASLDVTKSDNEKWLRFELNPVHLSQNEQYGFRLQSHDAFIAMGETAWPVKESFENGKEWTASSNSQEGRYYSYFSLAFKVEMRA